MDGRLLDHCDPFLRSEHALLRGIHQHGHHDENFLIIRDDPTLAEAYTVHIMAAYAHYRFRAAQGGNKGLSRSDDWMDPRLEASLDELRV